MTSIEVRLKHRMLGTAAERRHHPETMAMMALKVAGALAAQITHQAPSRQQ